MATQTQKNFKKQMNQVIKEQKNAQSESTYSYLERGVIRTYYASTPKRKIAINLSTVVVLLIVAYYGLQILNLGSLAATGRSIQSQISPINEVVRFVQEVERYDMHIMEILTETLKKNMEPREGKRRLEGYLESYERIPCNKNAEAFRDATAKKYQTAYEIILYLQLDEIEKANVMIEEMNRYNEKQRAELLALFDKVRIQYSVLEDGSIRYEYVEYGM